MDLCATAVARYKSESGQITRPSALPGPNVDIGSSPNMSNSAQPVDKLYIYLFIINI